MGENRSESHSLDGSLHFKGNKLEVQRQKTAQQKLHSQSEEASEAVCGQLEPQFEFLAPMLGDSQPPPTPSPGVQMPSSGFCKYCTHVYKHRNRYIDTHTHTVLK